MSRPVSKLEAFCLMAEANQAAADVGLLDPKITYGFDIVDMTALAAEARELQERCREHARMTQGLLVELEAVKLRAGSAPAAKANGWHVPHTKPDLPGLYETGHKSIGYGYSDWDGSEWSNQSLTKEEKAHRNTGSGALQKKFWRPVTP